MKSIRNPQLAYKVHKAKDGVFVARIPVLYLVAYGETRLEAMENLVAMETDAIKAEKKMGNPIPTYEESLEAIEKLTRGGARRDAGRKRTNLPLRSERVTIQFTLAEKQKLKKLAKRESKPVSTFLHEAFKKACLI